ncbi:MAG: sulfatase-like hydrolase/transferase [Bacteriovoracaceae bacterium]
MQFNVRELRGNLILGFSFLVLTLAQQYLFFAIKGSPMAWLSPGKTLGFLAFYIAVTFVKEKSLRFIFLHFILVANFFQMVHVSFFGTQVLPFEIFLLFSQMGEIQGSVLGEPIHLIIPLMLTLLPLGASWFLQKKWSPGKTVPVLGWLFVAYFLYNPARTYVTGNSWGRQPSVEHLGGFNIYLSMSYFAGKILPHKIFEKAEDEKNSSTELTVKGKTVSDWDKIIVVLGESHSPHLMSLFGYPKETTPYLDSLKNNPDFYSGLGLSTGVSTDISVAFFMNLGFGKAGGMKAAQGKHCLLKLARDNGFRTHFWSTQSRQQLRYIAPYICHSSLDSFRPLEDVDPGFTNEEAASDLKLLGGLEAVFAEDGKSFVVLHQRGSHSPWQYRYSPESTKFGASPGDERSFHYENSIVEFDRFWKELDQFLSKRKERVLVVYVSDHGESVGKKGRWGHGFLDTEAFEIPIIVRSYGKSLAGFLHKRPPLLTQYNVGLLIAAELGYELNQSPEKLPQDFEIYGNDIDGFAGRALVTFEDEKKYIFKVK